MRRRKVAAVVAGFGTSKIICAILSRVRTYVVKERWSVNKAAPTVFFFNKGTTFVKVNLVECTGEN